METEQQIEQTSFDGEYAGIHPPAIGVDQYFETEVGLMNHLLLRMIHLNWYSNWMKQRYIQFVLTFNGLLVNEKVCLGAGKIADDELWKGPVPWS